MRWTWVHRRRRMAPMRWSRRSRSTLHKIVRPVIATHTRAPGGISRAIFHRRAFIPSMNRKAPATRRHPIPIFTIALGSRPLTLCIDQSRVSGPASTSGPHDSSTRFIRTDSERSVAVAWPALGFATKRVSERASKKDDQQRVDRLHPLGRELPAAEQATVRLVLSIQLVKSRRNAMGMTSEAAGPPRTVNPRLCRR